MLYIIISNNNYLLLESDLVEPQLQVSLEMILSFFTGADAIPPLGYQSVTLNFNSMNKYPTASTCAVQLTLPTRHTEYKDFKRELNVAFSMHGGFGLI